MCSVTTVVVVPDGELEGDPAPVDVVESPCETEPELEPAPEFGDGGVVAVKVADRAVGLETTL